jgi:uncharacterized protein
MTLDDIRHQLSTARDLPHAALAAAVEQAEALTPEVIGVVDLACRGVILTLPQEKLLFYGVHVLAAAHRTELYGALLALIEWRPDDLDLLLSDTDLQALLISTCGPEGEAPFVLLENPNIPGDVKWSLFLLIARLVWEGRASREQFVALLDRFDRAAAAEPGDMAWLGWQDAISLLGLTEFEDRVRAGWQAGRMPFDRPVDREEWVKELYHAAREPRDTGRFAVRHAEAITDVFASLRWMSFVDPDEPPEEEATDSDDPARDIRLTLEEREWLRNFLFSEIVPRGTMNFECADGFLTALAAGPKSVPREEWRGHIWGAGIEGSGEEPAYETEAQESYVRELFDRHMRTIETRLKAGYRHRPALEDDAIAEFVEEWAIGFSIGMDMRPGSWDPIARHKQAAFAVASIILLLPPDQLAGEDEELEPLDDEARAGIVQNLPDLIRSAYAFWHDQPVLPLFEPRRSQKIGRNEPCPCGSGRKYKKCCGANAPN